MIQSCMEKCKSAQLRMQGKITLNMNSEQEIKGQALESVTKACDLGVEFRRDPKVEDKFSKAFNKANRMLGMINRSVRYKTLMSR